MKVALTALIFAAASLVGGVGAQSEELAPFAGHSVALGAMHGIAYYRPSYAGFEVVVTLADGPQGRPVRFVTTLGRGQIARISAPANPGQTADIIEIKRDGDRLVIDSRPSNPQYDEQLAGRDAASPDEMKTR